MADTKTSNIPVIDLSMLRKQQVMIDFGDDKEHILEINITDMNVVTRLSDGYNRLLELDEGVKDLGNASDDIKDTDTDDVVKAKLSAFAEKLKAIDNKMRDTLDYIFDANVSEVCCPNGSMYDPIGGSLRYEYIVNALMNLYGDSVSKELAKVKAETKARRAVHTAKYTKKKSK